VTPPSSASEVQLRVTQVRSGIGTKPKHRATLRALGLRGVGRTRVLPDSTAVRGMVARVSHLVEVAPAGTEDRPVRPQRRSEALKARHAEVAQAPKAQAPKAPAVKAQAAKAPAVKAQAAAKKPKGATGTAAKTKSPAKEGS